MPRTVLRTSLLLLVALAVAPATARATYDIASGSLVWPTGHELVYGSTGEQVLLQNNIGLAYLAPDGTVLDRRISSWVPGTDDEFIRGADIAPDGNAWLGANANGNYTFIEVIPGSPLELDNGPCPNGTLTLDLPQDAFIHDIAVIGTKLYGVGSIGDDMLLVRLDITTCTIDFAVAIDPAAAGGEPAEGYSFVFVGEEIVIGGYMGEVAILVNTDLDGNVDLTFGDGDGTEEVDPDAVDLGDNTFFGVGLVGDSIYGVGAGGAAQPGSVGQFSFIGRYELDDGDFVDGRTLDLSSSPFLEGLASVGYFAGDGFAVGQGYNTRYNAAMVRFNLDDLEGDAVCGGDGDVLLDFGGESGFGAMEMNGSLFGIGFVDNGTESFDYLKAKLTAGCAIDPAFAGGPAGNRIGFIGAPPIGVRQPPVNGPQPPPAAGPSFGSAVFRDFCARPGRARVDLRRGRIGPLLLEGPETAPAGNDDTYRIDVAASYRAVQSSGSQRGRRAPRVRVASKRFNLAEGTQRRVFLKLNRKGKAALRRSRGKRVAIRLQLRARNEAGERLSLTSTNRLRVQRPKKKRRG